VSSQAIFENPCNMTTPIMTRIESFVMRSNPGISPPLRHDLPADAAGSRAAIWKTMLGLFLAINSAFWFPAVPTEAQSQSSRTYVSGLGKDTNACTAAAPCLTLQAALAQTAPGGEIYSLDSANYGYVTVNKAVSILAGRGAAGILATSNLSGVTINAGANDVITLQGLDIDGAGSGVSGIEFYSGASLNIQDSVIRGFTTGINFHPGGSNALSVSRTLISNNSTGINFQSAGTSTAVLNDVQLVNNSTGITALGASTSALANVTIQSSVVANNSTVGVTAGAYSAVSVANSTVTNNFAGLQAQAASSLLQVSGSNVTGNRTAWQTANGGQVTSASQNSFGGNASGDTAPPPASLPPPTFIAKNIMTDFGATCNGVADDALAFATFNAWAQVQTLPVQLTIPSGHVCTVLSFGPNDAAAWWVKGIKNLVVIGYGATITNNNRTDVGFTLGGRGLFGDSAHVARVATVTAGSSCVTLLSPAQTSIFLVGAYALMGGLDLQGIWQSDYGFPPNLHFFEYVKISTINAATGAVCFNSPLNNTYKSTWPSYNNFSVGAAALFALDPSWDTTIEYRGLVISQDQVQTYSVGRSVTYRDVTFTGGLCGVPTLNLVWQAINTNMSNCLMEADKLVGTVILNGVVIKGVQFQSSSIDMLDMSNSNVTSFLSGTPKRAVISDSRIANFNPGAYGYGRSDEVSCTNCVLPVIAPYGVTEKGPGDVGVNYAYAMSNGVITFSNTNGALRWAVPGNNLMWRGVYNSETAFRIVDVTQDANNTYVQTTLPGGFPPVPLTGGKLFIQVHPAPKFTCTNCTGGDDAVDLSQAPAGAPIFSYSKRTYTGGNLHPYPNHPTRMNIWGSVLSVSVNVSTPYTGALPALTLTSMIQPMINTDYSGFRYSPTINLKMAGLRSITPSSVTGSQSADSNLSMPGPAWFADFSGVLISSDVSGESPSLWPTVTIEIATDQGVINP
jgi:hypothetical protein